MINRFQKLLIAVALLLLATNQINAQTLITYQEDASSFSNPERGFYSSSISYSSSPSAISQSYLTNLKSSNISMIHMDYAFNTFRSTAISESFLKSIQNDLDLLRANGFKMVIRFAYTFNEPAPWNDAPLSIILSHIDQLTLLLQKNADVIAVVEAGFIGRWGEWHTSSNGLANTSDMKTILFKLLDAVPKSRNVLVRYQQAKKDIFNTNFAISETQAYDQSNQSRTGHHNDCFLASADDWGTYWPIDAASLKKQKDYLNQENKYLPQVGETCNCNPPGSDCKNAKVELEQMRWSALNHDYIPCVVNGWSSQGCYSEIGKRLGYRLRLIQSVIPNAISIDSALSFNIVIKNDGYASPFNPRDFELVLRSKKTGTVNRIKLDADPRKWLPDNGDISIEVIAQLPSNLTPGNYDVLVNLPDPEKSLNTNPAYSIRLANKNVWEPLTGYNSLLHSVTVLPSTTGLNEHKKNSGRIIVSPNPIDTNTLTVLTLGLTGKKNISITDMAGRIVFNQKFGNSETQTIHLNQSLPTGMYIVKVASGKDVLSQKLSVN